MTTEAPTLPQLRAAMINQLTKQQRRLICVWLGLEAVERNSNDVFELGKDFINLIDLESLAGDVRSQQPTNGDTAE
jgi:hypothetical protein